MPSKTYVFHFIILCLTASLLLACSKDVKDVLDQSLKLSYDDYKKVLLPEAKKEDNAGTKASKPHGSSVPGIAPILVAPRRPSVDREKMVSLSVTEDVPLKDVLLELGRLADVDMELDPTITGGIILKVKNKPFSDVIERIARLADLRYSIENGSVKIERDTPYLENYPVDFLNNIRSNKSNIAVSTSIGDSSGGGGDGEAGGTTSSGSTSSISSEYDGDLWKSIEANINKILGTNASGANAQARNSRGGAATSTERESFVSINKQAGIINVLATQKEQKDVKKYIDYVKDLTAPQVLIEAKILEVTLNDEYHTGINWNAIDRNLGIGIQGDFTQNINGFTDTVGVGVLSKTATNLSDPSNLEAMVNMTQMFGTTRTLSSPRLHAMNNQQALLSFTENSVYFSLDIETTDAQQTGGTITEPAKTTVNSTLHTVPIGVILTLQPFINTATNEITMSIRPTLSRITDNVDDPAVTYLIATSDDADLATLQSTVPVVEVREMDSVLKIQSGQIMVIGGLMEERASNNDSGAPFISTIPWFGHLFKSVGKSTDVVQTVIFIKATIIPPRSSVSPDDKLFYKTFTRDQNPLAF